MIGRTVKNGHSGHLCVSVHKRCLCYFLPFDLFGEASHLHFKQQFKVLLLVMVLVKDDGVSSSFQGEKMTTALCG